MVMMPIGVPKVAYRVPGAGSADWVDIYNRLYRERIIFLGQEIDDDYANQIIGVLLVRTLPFSGTPCSALSYWRIVHAYPAHSARCPFIQSHDC